MKPYYSCAYGDLYKGDCLEVMPLLGQKVDLVLTDPPYGTTACKWDSVIPFEDMWKVLSIVTEKHTPKVLFGSEPFSSLLRCSNLKEFKYDWVWEKNSISGFALAKKQPLRNHENISVFYGKQCSFNPIKEKRRLNPDSKKRLNYGFSSTKGKNELQNIKKVQFIPEDKELSYPKTVKFFEGVATSSKNRKHPTQKPVALLEYLIKTYSLPQQLVLDFTAGSSSTAIACINTNRRFIMIEKEEKYCEISAKRIEEHFNKMWSDL